jgi:hypothetical protein
MACPGAERLNIREIVVFLQNSILNTRFALPGLGQGVLEYGNDGFEGIVDNSMVFFRFHHQRPTIPPFHYSMGLAQKRIA